MKWEREEAASADWYYGFMNRHPKLSLKAAEGMSIARATAFNKTSVATFFQAYTSAIEKYGLTANRIFNLDETALSTVMKPVKVVSERGLPVASTISRERGVTMTFVGIICAAGNYLPPVFIIPRKRWNDAFMRGTVDGSKGILNPSGWMNGESFLETLKHIQDVTFCSLDNRLLLIMDNAECHMSIQAIEFCIANGIVIVTLPPHTTDKLQPLDVSIYSSFKNSLHIILNEFTIMNPNKHITEHMLPEFASRAWVKSCTPSNVLSGFATTGIWPINSEIFGEDAFLGAEVTERPPPEDDSTEQIEQFYENIQEGASSSSLIASPIPSRPSSFLSPSKTTTQPLLFPQAVTPEPTSPSSLFSPAKTPTQPVLSPQVVTPESVRPYPKG